MVWSNCPAPRLLDWDGSDWTDERFQDTRNPGCPADEDDDADDEEDDDADE